MIYILDTDILSLLGHRDSPQAPRIRRRIAELPPGDDVVTTVVNYEEQMRGWMALLTRAKKPEAQVQVYARLLQHLQTFRRITVLPYDSAAASVMARLGVEPFSAFCLLPSALCLPPSTSFLRLLRFFAAKFRLQLPAGARLPAGTLRRNDRRRFFLQTFGRLIILTNTNLAVRFGEAQVGGLGS